MSEINDKINEIKAIDSESATAEQKIQALEKANRILQKQLERADRNRLMLERSRAQAESLMKATIAELRESQSMLEVRSQELEQALANIQNMQSRLLMTEKMTALGVLVAGVAHEINNPVSFIYGNLRPAAAYVRDLLALLRLYQQHYPDPAATIQSTMKAIDLEFLQKDCPRLFHSMEMGAERIKQIVLSLRTFARLDEAELKAVDLHEGIDSTLVILDHRLKTQPARPAIVVQKDYGNLPTVECYAGQMNQVFINILINAIDALDEKQEKQIEAHLEGRAEPLIIRIQTMYQDPHAIVRIADNALGIPWEIQPRLFDPFFTTKAVGKGTGLGLATSYQIITERHRGSLRCVSKPNYGTEFIITLPIR